MTATIRATLHHGDFREVTTFTTAGDTITPGDVCRALKATAYGTLLRETDPDAEQIADEINAGTPTGRGWVHLERVKTTRRTITLILDVEDGPHDVDDTVAEFGAALTNWIPDGWGESDDTIHTNGLTVVDVVDVERGISL